MQVGWGWRSRIRNPVRRSLPLAFVALAKSDTPNLTAAINNLNAYSIKYLSDSASYAGSCYASEDTCLTWQDCSTFLASKLPLTQTNTSCPVDAEICTAPSIKLDTGFMVSDLSFGMNAPPQNRVKYRKVTDCAPIEVSKFPSSSLTAPTETRVWNQAPRGLFCWASSGSVVLFKVTFWPGTSTRQVNFRPSNKKALRALIIGWRVLYLSSSTWSCIMVRLKYSVWTVLSRGTIHIPPHLSAELHRRGRAWLCRHVWLRSLVSSASNRWFIHFLSFPKKRAAD